MQAYLTKTIANLKAKKYESLTIIIGNESCDLDSAVSSLVYATFLEWQHEQIKCKRCTAHWRNDETYKDELFVPVLNVDREDFDLKTEIVYCLEQFGIDRSLLVFRNDCDFQQLVTFQKTEVVLVDHHTLASKDRLLAPYVTEIIDHRPTNRRDWPFKNDTRVTMEIVGSCATLVAERIKDLSVLLSKNAEFFTTHPVCNELLHSTIVLDTVNFSKEFKKATKKDEEMITFLEEFIEPFNAAEVRQCKLQQLQQARSDVSALSAEQILKKDIKILNHFFIPSFPITVEAVLKKPHMQEGLEAALIKNNCSVALLLGMSLTGTGIERDLAIYCCDDKRSELEPLIEFLQKWAPAPFQLTPMPNENLPNALYFKQHNLTATRKQYIQALNAFMEADR